MRKILFILYMLIPAISFSQYKYYKDSSFTQSFNYLSGTTSVNNGLFWDDPDYTVPLGFMFHLFNDSSNQLYLSSNLGLGAFVSIHPVSTSSTNATFIMASGCDLQDRDTSMIGSFSPISYTLSGTTPSRIFKMEWKNAGFLNAIDNGQYTDSMNLQLWLYETSNIVEVRFGNGNYVSPFSDLYDGGPGALVAIVDSLDLNTSFARMMYFLKNNPTNPALDSLVNLGIFSPPGMNGNPASGSVYRFIPKVISNTNVGYSTYTTTVSNDILYLADKNELRIDIFNIDTFNYLITDLNGKAIEKGRLQKGRKNIDTKSFASGMYVLKLLSDKENVSFKFIR